MLVKKLLKADQKWPKYKIQIHVNYFIHIVNKYFRSYSIAIGTHFMLTNFCQQRELITCASGDKQLGLLKDFATFRQTFSLFGRTQRQSAIRWEANT